MGTTEDVAVAQMTNGIDVIIRIDSNNDGDVDETIETTWEELAVL